MDNSDIFILPELWPDETIYSLVARIARLNGMDHIHTIRHLLGEEYPTSIIRCPVNIRHFCKATKYAYGFPKDILQLTIMPLMVHLGDVSSSDIADIETGNLRPEFGAMIFGKNKGNHWRVCRECVDRDVRVYGVSYWHRSHQLPTCLYCPEHGVMLDRVDMQRVRLNDRLCLPNEFHKFLEPKNQYSAVDCKKIGRDMSILGRDALADYSSPFAIKVIKAAFYEALKQMLLVAENGEVNLNDYIKEFKPKELSGSPIISMLQLLKINSPKQLQNEITNEFASKPIARLLLVYLLFGSWGAFKEQCRWQEAFVDGDKGTPSMVEIAKYSVEEMLLAQRKICLEYKSTHVDPNRYEFMKKLYRTFRWLRQNDRNWIDIELPLQLKAKSQGNLFND